MIPVLVTHIQWFINRVIFWGDFLLSVLKNKILQSLNDRYKWDTSEMTRLEAVLSDYNAVVSSVEQIQQRATQFWDSELGVAELRLQLDETQTAWLRKTEHLVREANLLSNDYESVIKQEGSFLSKVAATWKFPLELKQATEKINDHSQKKGVVKLIVELVEVSKSKVRRLQDGPIDEKDHASISSKPWFRSGASLVRIFRSLTVRKPNLKRGLEAQVAFADMQLMLLYAFMKDLRGLQLESAVENAWARDAQQIISTTEIAINVMFCRVSRLSLFGDWAARRVFKREMELLSRKVSNLFEAKSRYGFTFTRRVSSTFTHSEPLPPELDVARTLSGIDNEQMYEKNKKVREQVQRVCTKLKTTRANEGARVTRLEIHKQLQRLASEARYSSSTYAQSRRLPFSSLRLHRSRETRGILKQVGLLEMSISMYSIMIVEDSSSVVGLEENIHAIVSELTAQRQLKLSFFCITGIHGIGKTTLAKKIYNHTTMLNNLHVRRWFSLPRESDEFFLFLKREKGSLKNHEISYLLVFDNLESNDSWNALHGSLMGVEIRATIKIVITTRKTTVASYVNPTKIYRIRLRTKDESWEFFTQMVPMPSQTETTTADEVEALSRKVVAKTGGLPLAILYLGYRFTEKRLTKESLTKVLERVALGQNQSMWFDAQDLNKDDLESQPILGRCLSYFESFPMDFEMPARRLVAVLVAQGLVESEGRAYELLADLINRNMIQVLEKRLNGKVKTCRFPSNLREPWQRRRREARPIRSWYLITTGLERQLTYHFADTDANSSHRIPSLRSSAPSFLYEESFPNSIMFFDSREGSRPGEDIGKFLYNGAKGGRFRDLLVLDLEGVYRPNLPQNIGDLKQLTYLGLRWTDIETIPSSIKKLLNLQTLDVKHTSIQTLPVSVWKLTKLRYLYLNNRCQVKFMPKPNHVSMDHLVTLTGAFLNGDSPLKEGLDKLENLRKLGLDFQLTSEQQKVLEESISKLKMLQSLSLSSVGQELDFTTLEDLTGLSSLWLYGQLKRRSPTCITETLPMSLTELVLSASQLPENAMGNLTRLQNLKSLSFFSGSYQGTAMVFPPATFPQLVVLNLWSLDPLEKITIEEGAMKSLWEMEIRSCGYLKTVDGLTRLETLQELKLTNMPSEFAGKVENYFKEATERARLRIVHTPRIRTHNCVRSETETCGLHIIRKRRSRH